MLQFIKDLFGNYLLMSAFGAWFLAQFLKIPSGIFRQRQFSVRAMLFGNGGMPSSHTAAVCSMTFAALLRYGVASPWFALCGVLALIVMNDAMGVRRETGEQAKVLNRIVADLPDEKTDGIPKDMKELVGHTPFQVLVGAVLGIAVAVLMQYMPWIH